MWPGRGGARARCGRRARRRRGSAGHRHVTPPPSSFLADTPNGGVPVPLRRRGPGRRRTSWGRAPQSSRARSFQVQPRHGHRPPKESGLRRGPAAAAGGPPAFRARAGPPARRPCRSQAPRPGRRAPRRAPGARPAARPGLQDQGRPQEALQGLLPGEEARALVHLLQDQPKAQAETDVEALPGRRCCVRRGQWHVNTLQRSNAQTPCGLACGSPPCGPGSDQGRAPPGTGALLPPV